ncbi:MAG: prolipoprotein diacylglyceryl transferase [Clostridia bacterium]|nr:prolipoprotein diacylglyceryl transferase [Clostridia bacterium]
MQFQPYGIWLAAVSLIGLLLFANQARKQGLKPETASWLPVIAIPLSVLLSRLLYCLCRMTWFLEQGAGWFFSFTDGGFMMFGAFGGLLLATWLTARMTNQKFTRVADAVSAPGLVLYGLGRIADLIAGQGYGWPIDDWFSVDAFDAEEYTGMSLFHLEDASFFEGLPFSVQDSYYGNYRWAVALFIGVAALVFAVVIWKLHTRREGSRAIMASAILCSLTVLMESMRQDDLMRWGVVRVSQILSAVAFAVLLLLCQLRRPRPVPRASIIRQWVSLLLSMGLVMAAEFMLEKKIVFLDFVPMDGCYALMILACVWLVLAVRCAWKQQDR